MKLRNKLLLAGLAVVLLIAGALVYAHYRLKGQLEAYKATLCAQGEKLAVAECLLPPLANVTNGASAFLRAMAPLPSINSSNSPSFMRLISPGKARVAWQQAKLVEWESSDVWSGFAAQYQDYQEALAELRSTILKCQALDFQPDYSAGLFRMQYNYLTTFRRAGQWLTAAAMFELHRGQPTAAWENLRAACLLVKQYDREPIMLSQSVRQSAFYANFYALWESLQQDQWSDAQWRELQAALEAYRPMDLLEPSLRLERALSSESLAQLRDNPARLSELGLSWNNLSSTNFFDSAKEMIDRPRETFRDAAMRLAWPTWFSYQEEEWCLRAFQSALEGSRRVSSANSLYPEYRKLCNVVEDLDRQATRIHMVTYFGADDQSRFLMKTARAECVRQLAITAIALKRYSLKHGGYPADLKQLTPEYLAAVPRDLMDGQPLRFSLLSEKSFRLYSIGDDGQDNGGDGSCTNNSGRINFQNTQDWVWPQPATPEEVEAFHQKLGKKQGTK